MKESDNQRIEEIAESPMANLWLELYGFPMEYSLYLARLDSDLGRGHKSRIEAFLDVVGDFTNEP